MRCVPLPRAALRFAEVYWRHLLGYTIAHSYCPLAIPAGQSGGGEVQPHVGFDIVLVHALTVGIEAPEVEMGAGATLLGSQAVPGTA